MPLKRRTCSKQEVAAVKDLTIKDLQQRVAQLEHQVATLTELVTPSKSETKIWNHVD